MKAGERRFADLLARASIRQGMHLCIHVSMRNMRRVFPGLRAEMMIQELMRSVGTSGSLLVPTFSFSWKKINGIAEPFDPSATPSAVGTFSNVFRNTQGVIRTSAPTHSFALWGKAAEEISSTNAPESPLGAGSPMEWLDGQASGSILLLGTDFASVSYLHYLEILAPIPTLDVFPWPEYGIEAIGIGPSGAQELSQVPGCSKSFTSLEEKLNIEGRVPEMNYRGLRVVCMDTSDLKRDALPAIRREPTLMLCPPGSCKPCDHRRSNSEANS